MPTFPCPPLVLRLSSLAGASAMVVGLIGALALAGWAFQVEYLTSLVPGLVAMNPATAVGFALSAAALWLLRHHGEAGTGSIRRRRCGQACAALVLSIGLVKLSGYVFAADLGIDRWLFRGVLGDNCMAPNTAFHFAVMGLALLLLDVPGPRGVWPAQVLPLMTAAGSLLAVVGYAFDADALYGVASYIPMALNTAVAFHVLALGVLLARPERGAMALLTSQAAGGLMVRRLLPVSIAVPVLLGWLRLEGERAGLYDNEYGVALIASLTTILFLAATCWTGRALDLAEADRRAAQEALQRAHAELEDRVRERTDLLVRTNQELEAEMAHRGRAEAERRQSAEQFRLLVEGVEDYAILMLDLQGRLASWNLGAERITGYRADEILGRPVAQFYPADDVQRGKPSIELAVAASEGRYEDEGWRVRKDGSRFWANVVVAPLRDEDGELCGFSKITRDITERREAEERVRQLNADLEDRVAQLAAANRDLAQKNQENELFVYSVSHDLRSPLVNLQGFSQELALVSQDLREILCDPAVPPPVRDRGLSLVEHDMAEAVRFIQTAVLRLSNIIDALLRLSRAGRVEYRPQSLELGPLVRRIVEALSATIAERGATVEVGDLPPVWADPTAVEQVFANLIGNALNYLDPQRPGVIEIGCREATDPDALTDPDAASVRVGGGGGAAATRTYFVRDNGLGIPEGWQAKVFQAFQRLHPDAAPGEGMGLAIVRRMVERHGGRVWIESTAGVGSTFFVELRARPASPAASRTQGDRETIAERNFADADRTPADCAGRR